MDELEKNGTVRDKERIIATIQNQIGKLCMLDVYKEKQFALGIQGKLSIAMIEDNTVYYDIKNFNFTSASVDNVCFFGAVLRIQIRP